MLESDDANLRQAAALFAVAHATVLGALDHAQTQSARARDELIQSAEKGHLKAVAIARNRAAQQVIEQSLKARDCESELAPAATTSLSVAEYVTLGSLTLPGAAAGVNTEVAVPFVVPLIGRSNVVIDASALRATGVAQELIWQALSNTAAAQLDVVGYDPLLAGIFAPFASLKTESGNQFSVINRAVELEALLDRIAVDIQSVNDVMRGSSNSLLDFRVASGMPVERLQLIVLFDYPEGVSEEAHRRILALMKVGPAAGISFVIASDLSSKVSSPWLDAAVLSGVAEIIQSGGQGARWSRHPQLVATITSRTPVSLAEAVDAHALVVREAENVKVPFSAIQAASDSWMQSSAEGLTFAIGAVGRRVVHIVLGDERLQRHNMLVTGAVGQGKSNLLKVIIHSLAERYSPAELEMYLLDFKEGVTLFPFAPTSGSPDFLPHAVVLGLESDREYGLAVFRHIEAEFGRRARLFRSYGDDIVKYRAAVPEARMPRIVLMVDEFHRLFEPTGTLADSAAALLEAIARRGRSYGVHLILASQTISGIQALMTKESGLYSQFPIRLALKNSLAESYSTLTQGNDGAFALRGRGQAVLNLEYGASGSNEPVLIAAADETELAQLRIGWWNRTKATTPPPSVFDGSAVHSPATALSAIRRLRARVVEQGMPPAALVGLPIAVSAEAISVSLGAEPGAHIAVLGAGENTEQIDEGDAPANNGVGVLQAAALSLALQHPEGNATFVSIDLLDDSTAVRSNQRRWYSLMETLGYTVRVVDKNGLQDYLREIAGEIAAGETGAEEGKATYILAFAFDRAGNLETPDAFAHTPLDDLHVVFRDGPTASVHLIGWWANSGTYLAQRGYQGGDWIKNQLLLRLDLRAAQEILGPFVEWSVRDNRGLLSNPSQLGEPTMLIPFAPIGNRDSALFTTIDWDEPWRN